MLMRTEQHKYEIYEGGVKASPLTFPSRSAIVCGDDGQKLIFDDDAAGLVYEVDIPGGVLTRTLATYDKDRGAIISFSPDLKSVAKSESVTLAPGAGNLNVVELDGPKDRVLVRPHWSHDSSELFGISRSKGKARREIVEVLSAQNQRVGSGALPAGFFFMDGGFANAQTLYLYLGLSRHEFNAGYILKCRIENWKCDRIARNVLSASVGGDGALGIVFAVGKYSNDGETETFPPRYLVEIRSGSGKTVARQTFNSAERFGFEISVSPSGKKAILSWYARDAPGCPAEKKENGTCHSGITIDLPTRSR